MTCATLPLMPDIAGKVDVGDRFMTLEMIRLIHEKGPTAFKTPLGGFGEALEKELSPKLAQSDVDWDSGLISINRWYDRHVAALGEKDHAKRTKKRTELWLELKKLNIKPPDPWTLTVTRLGGGQDKGSRICNLVIWLFHPTIDTYQRMWEDSQQNQENLLLAFALAAYYSDEKQYPRSLSELSPKYLKEIPKDLFSGKPLIYKPKADGYLLYSVGPNGKDDEGRPHDLTLQGDDIAVVMPQPALKKP